jgi:hypothetical protein
MNPNYATNDPLQAASAVTLYGVSLNDLQAGIADAGSPSAFVQANLNDAADAAFMGFSVLSAQLIRQAQYALGHMG